MKRKTNGERGMSLVEVTIILMVLALVTSVLAPSIADYVNDAKQVKAKEDVEAIGTGIVRMLRDVGSPCLRLSKSLGCTKENKVDILRSEGPDVVAADLGATATAYTNADIQSSPYNWDDDRAANGDTILNQLVDNNPNPGYDTPAVTDPVGHTKPGLQFGLGWRGAYLSGPIGGDPFNGKPYLVNAALLAVATDASAGTGEGQKSGGWSRDVIVLSAGPNGLYDIAVISSFGGVTTQVDDVFYVIAGDTR